MAGTILILNGPNLGLLGTREPEIYGHETLSDVEARCRAVAEGAGFALDFRQTDIEHEMVGWLHAARGAVAGVAINPAAFSYAAYSVLDALLMLDCPVIEVHISNIHRRAEKWRANSIVSAAVTGTIAGLGTAGYVLAVRQLTGTADQA